MDSLDAYGHMRWSVGHEDWTAYVDAIRAEDGCIAYEVVVECHSAHFLDTVENGTIEKDKAAELLRGLLGRYAEYCADLYAGLNFHIDQSVFDQTNADWLLYVNSLFNETEEEEEDVWDPVSLGWVGSDGRV